MDQILSLIEEYGTWVYILLFAYCALKSGALPLFAGFAAQAGALDVAIVAIASFAGGYLGDEARFAIARKYGAQMGEGRPKIARLIKSGKQLLDRYGAYYIFIYRYPKGMRTIGALPVGLTDMPWAKFTFLNASSAALWAFILVGAGYVFGDAIEQAVRSGWGAVSVLLLAVFAVATFLLWRRVSSMAKDTI